MDDEYRPPLHIRLALSSFYASMSPLCVCVSGVGLAMANVPESWFTVVLAFVLYGGPALGVCLGIASLMVRPNVPACAGIGAGAAWLMLAFAIFGSGTAL